MKGRACQTLAALPRPPSAPARRGSPGRRRTSVWARALPDMQRGGRTMAAAAVGDRRRRRRSSSSAHARRGEWYRPLTRPPAPPPPRPAEPPPPPLPTHTRRGRQVRAPLTGPPPRGGGYRPRPGSPTAGATPPLRRASVLAEGRSRHGARWRDGTGREPVGPGAARGPRPPSLRGHRTLPRGRAHRKTRGMTGLPVCGCPFPKRRIARRSLRSLLLTGCR